MNIFRNLLTAIILSLLTCNLCAAFDPAAEAAKLKNSKINISVEDIKNLGMKFDVVEVRISNLKKEYDFIVISDLHIMAEDDSELSSSRKKAMLYRRDKHFNNPVSKMRPLDVWRKLPALLNKSNADAVFFNGDMCDTGSLANIIELRNGMKQLKIPFLYTREDHDAGAWNLTSKDISKQNAANAEIDGYPPFKVIEYDDLTVFSHSKSIYHIKNDVLEPFKQFYAKNKPMIVIQHVPIVPPNQEKWQKKHLWYGRIKPNAATSANYMKLIFAEKSPVIFMAFGHSHIVADYTLGKSVRGHIFDAAFKGCYGIIKVRRAEQ